MVNREAYPPNWETLARQCKEKAGWKCAWCSAKQFDMRLSRKGTPYIIYLAACHLNHDPENPSPELIALCPSCHGKLDYERREREKRVHLQQVKHLRLLIQAGQVEVKAFI